MDNIQNISSQPLVNALTNKQSKESDKKNEIKKIRDSISEMLTKMKPEFSKALPDKIMPFERFLRMAQTAIMSNSILLASDRNSLKASLMTAAQLGLEPNTIMGQAWLIPYRDWKTKKYYCQFQLGYKGLIALAYRNPQLQTIQAREVWEGDTFEFEYGLNPVLKHKPSTNQTYNDKEKPIYFYALWKSKNGGFDFQVMSNAEIENYRDRFSQTYIKALSDFNENKISKKKFDENIWNKHYIEMAKKTVLKKLLKYAPLRTEDLLIGLSCDETIKTEISDDMSTIKPIDPDIISGTATEIESTEDIKVPDDDDFPPCLGGADDD